jgi:hypothetical protein
MRKAPAWTLQSGLRIVSPLVTSECLSHGSPGAAMASQWVTEARHSVSLGLSCPGMTLNCTVALRLPQRQRAAARTMKPHRPPAPSLLLIRPVSDRSLVGNGPLTVAVVFVARMVNPAAVCPLPPG